MNKIYLLGLLVLLLLGCKEKIEHSTLPINSGFEDETSHWIVSGGVITTEAPRSGKNALFIANDSSMWSYAEQYIAVPSEAKKVTISGWLKTENVTPGNESWETALLNFEFVDTLFKHLDPYPVAAAELTGTTKWTKYSQTYDILENAHAIKLHCALGNALGKVWFDDLGVEFTDNKNNTISSQMIPQSVVFPIKRTISSTEKDN